MAQFSARLKHLKSATPIIIVGMHRSGTSMLTRMLEECGVFWGDKKDEYNESVFFQSINERLFNVAKATWDNPAPVEEYLSTTQNFSTAGDTSCSASGDNRIPRQTLPGGRSGPHPHRPRRFRCRGPRPPALLPATWLPPEGHPRCRSSPWARNRRIRGAPRTRLPMLPPQLHSWRKGRRKRRPPGH